MSQPLPLNPQPPKPHASASNSALRKRSRKSEYDFSTRRHRGAIGMSVIAVSALIYLRGNHDPWLMLAAEVVGALVAFYGLQKLPGLSSMQRMLGIGIACLFLPWCFDFAWRQIGNGNGAEIVMLTCLCWGSVALALNAQQKKQLSLSVVAGGFLTLFTSFISDHPSAVVFAYVWGVLCLWWLVSNQWELVEACPAKEVSRIPFRMPTVLVGAAVFGVVVLAFWGRIPVLRELQLELMPTSGGSKWTDSAASRGVGNGDALVAAKDHALTFGAVDTDFFLDSPKPSLFDVFSDQFGEPVKKNDAGKAQALSSENVRSDEGKFSESNRASSDTFSTQRTRPKGQSSPDDLASEALLFWKGDAGVRLAVDRFQTFDGVEWHRDPACQESYEIRSIAFGEKTWFQRAGFIVQSSVSPFLGSKSEALKFTRYGSPVIPTRAGTQMWSIDMLDRADFFAISQDECLSMPGRKEVPSYTVLRLVNSGMDLQRLESLMAHCSPGDSHLESPVSCQSEIASLAHSYAQDSERGWQQVCQIIDRLRDDFRLDAERAMDGLPLKQFIAGKVGPSYMFATLSALMLEHLGYETRLVRGFYVDPEHETEGEYAILSTDAHAWIEINVGHGYWVPLEPTPGYQLPVYRASWSYQLYRARYRIAMLLAGFFGGLWVLYRLRFLLFEAVCSLLWPIAALSPDRMRLRWLMRILDARFRLAGWRRPAGCTPRSRLLEMSGEVWLQHVHVLFRDADCLVFGGGHEFSHAGREALKSFWLGFNLFELKRIRRSLPS